MPVLFRLPWGGMDTTPVDPNDPANSDPVLANNTWEKIAAASEAGLASSLWNIGDEKEIALTGDYTAVITLQIAGFDHDIISDSGKKAGITFWSKELLSLERMNAASSNGSGWEYSEMRSTVMPKIKNSLPDELRQVIKTVNKVSAQGGSTVSLASTADDIFIPSVVEAGGFDKSIYTSYNGKSAAEYASANCPNGEGEQYAIVRTNEDLVKSLTYGSASGWWLRTVKNASSGVKYYYVIKSDGLSTGMDTVVVNNTSGVCFGLCV